MNKPMKWQYQNIIPLMNKPMKWRQQKKNIFFIEGPARWWPQKKYFFIEGSMKRWSQKHPASERTNETIVSKTPCQWMDQWNDGLKKYFFIEGSTRWCPSKYHPSSERTSEVMAQKIVHLTRNQWNSELKKKSYRQGWIISLGHWPSWIGTRWFHKTMTDYQQRDGKYVVTPFWISQKKESSYSAHRINKE